jgi:hypothetical protein
MHVASGAQGAGSSSIDPGFCRADCFRNSEMYAVRKVMKRGV